MLGAVSVASGDTGHRAAHGTRVQILVQQKPAEGLEQLWYRAGCFPLAVETGTCTYAISASHSVSDTISITQFGIFHDR